MIHSDQGEEDKKTNLSERRKKSRFKAASRGWGRRERKVDRRGVSRPPDKEAVAERLKQLRKFRWSSYRGYAGYEEAPEWLDSAVLLGRVQGDGEGYRELVEDRVRQGVSEDWWTKIRWGIVLGGERFARKVRGRIKVDRESGGRDVLRTALGFEDIVGKVERIKRAKWVDFRDRHGDWGRDLALWAAQRYSGLTLMEIGEKVGGLDYTGVSMAIRRLEARAQKNRKLRSAIKRLRKECEK